MHIYFSGIGGAGIAPLALVAKQAGYTVSGSDKQPTSYIDYLKGVGIDDIVLEQTTASISAAHQRQPIDWLVYSSAVSLENPDAPELAFCRDNGIRVSKRDEFTNQFIAEKGLQLVAVAGTHGKTTTVAMLVWLFKSLELPLSYLLPAKTSFSAMGAYDPASTYFVYEADEFDHNFLAFQPKLSLITGLSWDHHEIFPTLEDYQAAFKDFVGQSEASLLWQADADQLGLAPSQVITVLDQADPAIDERLSLLGHYNRLDGWLAIRAVQQLIDEPEERLIELMNAFRGLQRRMELIVPGLYSDYAHTPDKIRGVMSVATELAAPDGRRVVIVYEPLTDRRQHFAIDDYQDCFKGAEKVYWLPSYLAREDPNQSILTPDELISHLADPSIALSSQPGPELKQRITEHLASGDLVVAIAGGGGGSLDDWIRQEFKAGA